MIVELKLFALTKQLAGSDQLRLDLDDGATVADLRAALISSCPALEDLTPHLMFSINTDYADDETVIPDGAEVACIPPVSGG